MSYCPNCGKELSEGSKFCQNCGNAIDSSQPNNQQPVNNQPQYQPPYQQQYQQAYQPPYQQQTYQPPYQQYYVPQKNIVQLLSKKVNVQAVIWLIIACIQYILGIFNIVYGVNKYYDEQIVMGVFILVVAILNTAFSITNFKYSSEVLMPIVDGKRVSAKTGRPTGRPKAVKPDNWNEIYIRWQNKEITAVKAMEILNLKPNTFYKFAASEK